MSLTNDQEELIQTNLQELLESNQITDASPPHQVEDELINKLIEVDKQIDDYGDPSNADLMTQKDNINKILQQIRAKNTEYIGKIEEIFKLISSSPTTTVVPGSAVRVSSEPRTLDDFASRVPDTDTMTTKQFITFYDNYHTKVLFEIEGILKTLNEANVTDLPALKQLVKKLTNDALTLLKSARKSPTTSTSSAAMTVNPIYGGSQKRHRKRNKKTQRRRKTGKRMKFRL